MLDVLVNIDVPDLAAAIRFYEEGLGLTLRRRLFGGSVAELTHGAIRLYLLTRPAGSPAFLHAEQHRSYGRHWTPVHLDFVVSDVHAAVDRAERAGARLEVPVQTSVWSRAAMLADPWGNGFCLLEFVGSGYDAVAD